MVCVLLAACSDDGVVPQGGGGAASGTDSSATLSTGVADETTGGEADTVDLGGAADPQCTCAAADDVLDACDYESLAGLLPGCELDEPCSVVTVRCPTPGMDLYDCPAQYEYDVQALQCALEVLRDGQPARLHLEGEEDFGPFAAQPIIALSATGDGRVVRTSCMTTDVAGEYSPSQTVTMASPADHFAGCLELAAGADMYACLFDGLSLGVALATCG